MEQILMSYQNPNGWKLEELLNRLTSELIVKNTFLETKLEGETDILKFEVITDAIAQNKNTISLLEQAKVSQEELMKGFLRLGEDKGPVENKAKPRI